MPDQKEKMSKKMMKLDPSDTDRLRKFSRKTSEGKPLFFMPEGRYVRKGDRYIKTSDKPQGIIDY